MQTDSTEVSENAVSNAARIAHEANRAYCLAIGDDSQLPWEHTPAWQRQSAINGVRHLLNHPQSTPADMHESWLKHKLAEGWTWGIEKNPDIKQHPCMRPYEELPQEQRIKDHLFSAIVKAVMGL